MRSERAVVFLVGAVQFVNILDFMMVMPLGPDFAVSLGVAVEHIGLVGGAYTVAAGIAGLALSSVLDRFDRRPLLALCMCGLALGTVLGGFATGLPSLIAARVVAGAFGGPATSVALAIIADVVPLERRGRAMGAVMGAFSVASVVGVPAGLYLAQFAGWRAPFFVVGGCGLAITASVIWLLPPIAGHLNAGSHRAPMRDLLVRRETWLGLAMTALLTLSAFLLIPNLSAFIQFNMGWPRNDLGLLYMVGGAMSFVALRIFGRITDHFGAVPLSLAGSLAFTLCTALWLIVTPPPVSVLVLFPAMMISMSARNVANQTLLSRVPLLAHRAAFQSLNSATQHFASALAAILGASLLTSLPSGALVGVDNLAWIALSFAAVLPLVVWRNDRVVGARDAPSAVSD